MLCLMLRKNPCGNQHGVIVDQLLYRTTTLSVYQESLEEIVMCITLKYTNYVCCRVFSKIDNDWLNIVCS